MNRDGNYLAADQVIWNRKTGRGLRQGQCRHADPAGRQAGRRQCAAHRHVARRRRSAICWSCSRAARGSPRTRGTRTGGVIDARECDLLAVPGDDRHRLSQAAELGDHRGEGDRRSRDRASALRRRPSAAVRGDLAAAAGLQHLPRQRGRDGLACPGLQPLEQEGVRDRRAVPLADGPEPRPHAHAASLYRCASGDRGEVPRSSTSWGAFQLGGFLTYGTIESIDPDVTSTRKGFRGYFEANGKAQLDPLWSITSSLRVASDKTLTRRYDITNDDRLRNVVNVERISPDSYITIAGWAFEGLRAEDKQKQIPIALPAIDARFRKEDVCRRHVAAPGQQPRRSCGSRVRTRSALSPAPNGTFAG